MGKDMYEKKFKALAPQALTANGTSIGSLKIADPGLVKVKQKIRLSANTLPDLDLEIKRVEEDDTIFVGEVSKPIDNRTDISAYTIALSAAISWPEDQKRPNITADEFERAVYEEEPTVAKRVVLVDKLGKKYATDNPLPVQLSDGQINIGTVNAELEVALSHKDNTPHPGDVADSVRIGDGTDEMAVNPDGSINVNIVQSPTVPLDGLTISHNEISSVSASVETNIISLVAPSNNYRITKIEVSGDNVAHYRVKVNGSTIVNKRTYWSGFNETFNFEDFQNGLKLSIGDILTVTVVHSRPMLGSFEATVMVE